MKKIYSVLLLFFISITYSQFNPNAPWMESNLGNKSEKKSFKQIVDDFNEYWKDKDRNKKGSGYKPFKRWENFWQDHLDENGYLMSPLDFQKAVLEKKSSKEKSVQSRLIPISNWVAVGPFANASTQSSYKTRARGRVNIITADPNNPSTLYFGTPAGGLWKSTNNGTSWTPLTDELAQIGVSGIAIDNTNSNTIYISTGDKDAGDTNSIGVLKSTNGGASWNSTGLTLTGTSRSGDLVISPSNNQILLCATSTGLYRTSNGGTTWSVVQTGSFAQGSVRFKPGDSNVVYATSANRFYRSTDGGATFTNITSGLSTTGNRMILDVTAANANYIYILGADSTGGFQGIYRSTNGGTSFSKITPNNATNVFESTQSWYDLAFAASSTVLDELYVGCLNVWKTTDAGANNANWTKLNNWSTYNQAFTHADIHHLQFFNNKLYCGSDGGIYMSSDKGVNFTDITGQAQITQFYKIAVSKQTASNIAGGTQDNGGYAFSNSTWKGYHGGDGMDCAVNPLNKNVYYGFIYYGQSLYTSNDGGLTTSSLASAPAAETGTNDDGGNWVTPMAINSQGELFAGFTRLYKLVGSTWTQQSSSTVGTGDIDNIEIDPRNDNNIFVCNGTQLFKSTNKGVNFTNVFSAGSNITSISVNNNDSNVIYITTSGTGGGVFKSTDGGINFTSIGNGIPAIAKLVVKHQGRNTLNPIFVGTSIGVYYRDDSMSQFEPFDTNLPNAPVRDLEINLEDALLIAGTYGRGVWQTNIVVDSYPNDLKLISLSTTTTDVITKSNTINPTVTVKNNGSNNITSVNVIYNYNGSNLNYTWNGFIGPNNNQTIALPQIILTKQGAYRFEISTSIINDANADNNKSSQDFYYAGSETANTINNFENTDDDLLTYNESEVLSLWTRGVNSNGALATPNNNVYSIGQSGIYPNGKKSYLYSKFYDLSNISNPVIKFKMGFALEENWDVLYVEYSTNFGQSWTVLGEKGPNWYNSDRTEAISGGTDCFNCPGAQWTGGTAESGTTGAIPQLTNYFYPLTSITGKNTLLNQQNVIFRFVFHSDEAAQDLGVTIDDFVIEGTLANENFELEKLQIYPNPSRDIFNISLGDNIIDKIQVYDVTGKIVFEVTNTKSSNYSINLNNAASGIYFTKVESGNSSVVKRILKN